MPPAFSQRPQGKEVLHHRSLPEDFELPLLLMTMLLNPLLKKVLEVLCNELRQLKVVKLRIHLSKKFNVQAPIPDLLLIYNVLRPPTRRRRHSTQPQSVTPPWR